MLVAVAALRVAAHDGSGHGASEEKRKEERAFARRM